MQVAADFCLHPFVAYMKIAYLTSRRIPNNEPDVQQMLHTAAALRDCGIDVDILFPRRWRQFFLSRRSLTQLAAQYYNIPSDSLSLVPLPPVLHLAEPFASEGLDRVSTILSDVSGLFPGMIKAKKAGYEMIYTRRWLNAIASTRIGIPTIFETYTDISADHLRKYCNLDRLVGVVVHSRVAAASLVKRGLPEERIFVCYNGYNPADLLPALNRGEARDLLGLPREHPIVCYTGRLKLMKAPESILQVARFAPEVMFMLVGATTEEGKILQEQAREENISNIKIIEWVNPNHISRYLYAADILMIPPSSFPLRTGRTVLPLKTFLYMASGRPLIAPDLPDLREILEHERNAVLTPADQPEQAAKAVHRLLTDTAFSQALSKNAAVDAQGFTWQQRGRRLAQFLSSFSS
jgi:glycosyltransferase involved in cell wall biosynthesis